MAAAVRVPNSCLYDSKKGFFNPAWRSGEEWSGGHSQHAQWPTRSAAHTHFHKNTHAHRVTHTLSVHEKRSQKGSSAGVMVVGGGDAHSRSFSVPVCVFVSLSCSHTSLVPVFGCCRLPHAPQVKAEQQQATVRRLEY